MREVVNFCVGCPQGCIHCGRGEDVTIVYCDCCGEEIDFDDMIKYDKYEICSNCACALEDGALTEEILLKNCRENT